MENRSPGGLGTGRGVTKVVRGAGTGEEWGGDRNLTCSHRVLWACGDRELCLLAWRLPRARSRAAWPYAMKSRWRVRLRGQGLSQADLGTFVPAQV